MAYVPFLTILLPVRVESLAGANAGIGWLAYLSFGGALAASAGHLLFGWLIDVTGTRRPWIAAGLALVAALVAAYVLPILLLRLPTPVQPSAPPGANTPPLHPSGTVRRMWLARLAVQVAEAALFAYLYFWFQRVDAGMTDNRIASLFAVVLVASAPLALAAGRWADLSGRPFAPLVVGAVGAAAGLAGMAVAGSLLIAVAAFAVFALAAAMFLALHSAQTLRVLARRDGRPPLLGRDLRLFNLTNTIPSLIMPWRR